MEGGKGLKFTKNKVIAAALIIIVLAFAFWYGGGAPGLQGWRISPSSSSNENSIAIVDDNGSENDEKNISGIDKFKNVSNESDLQQAEELKDKSEVDKEERLEEKTNPETRPEGVEGRLSGSEKVELAKELAGRGSSPGVEKGSKNYSESQGMVIDSVTGKDQYLTDPVPEGKPIPIEPQNVEISDVEYTCTLSVRCDTILDNISWLDKEKMELVPEDGVIFPVTEVTFYKGESVFNVLHREMKKAKIHMEFSNTPIYNSVYIEGINNLYEFDCGELSGWMYKVNNWFPNYGASRYQLKDGDVIEWVYTCDLGVDLDGFYAIGE